MATAIDTARRRRPPLGNELTTRGQSFATSGVVLLVAGLVLGLADLTRLGLLLVLLVLLALAVGRRAPAALDVTRQIDPTTPLVGDTATVHVRVRAPGGRRTPTLVATEVLPRAVGDRPRFLLGPMSPGDTATVRYGVRPRMRGEVPLGPLTVQVRDSFGLLLRTVPAGDRHTILVHPRPVPLPGRALGAVDAGGEGGPAHGVTARGDDDLSVREYRHGDELRRIHWKATAHTGELMVRQEERPARRAAVVLLDSRAGAHSGRDETSTFEWAIVCVASVVRHLEDLGLQVVLVTDETADSVRSGRAADDDPMSVLARARLGSDDTFARCVHSVDEIATAGAIVVAVLGAAPDDELSTGTSHDLSGTRHPTSRGIAVVVAGDGNEPALRAAGRTAETLTRRGWVATTATPSADVADAWSGVTVTTGGRP